MSTYLPCDRRSIVHAFIPSTRLRLAWFAGLDLPSSTKDWTPELIANAKVVTRSQPVVGALVLHTYRVHEECEHQGEQPIGPEEGHTTLAVESGEGRIEPVHDPYAAGQSVSRYETYIGATDADAEPDPEEVLATGPFLRLMARRGLRPTVAVAS